MRSDAYSKLLSKPQLLSMAWQTFKMPQPPWQSGSKQIDWRFSKRLNMSFNFKGRQSYRALNSFMHLNCLFPMQKSWFRTITNLVTCHFVVPWDTRTCFTFLETSSQYLFGVRLPIHFLGPPGCICFFGFDCLEQFLFELQEFEFDWITAPIKFNNERWTIASA